jgi:hypothetical protein
MQLWRLFPLRQLWGAKAAYPTAQGRVDRRSIPLSFKSSSALNVLNLPPHPEQLQYRAFVLMSVMGLQH